MSAAAPTVIRTKNFVADAAAFIREQARKAIAERNEFRIALSGGNTPAPVYARIAAEAHDLPWESVRFTTQPLETPADDDALWPVIRNLRPAQTLMFASDYPHWDFDEPTHTLRLLPEEIRAAVAFDNAAKLFRLSAPVTA